MPDFAIPGQQLAVSEEAVASAGTYEADGAICAAVAGKVRLDPQNYAVSVSPAKRLSALAAGDRVTGLVHDVYDTVALVEFLPQEGVGERKAYYNRFAYLRISEIEKGYVESFRDVLRIGDVIAARVKEVKPLGIYLSIIDSELGVIKARCTVCRHVLKQSGSLLSCPNCGNKESRKTPFSQPSQHSRPRDYSSKGATHESFGRNRR